MESYDTITTQDNKKYELRKVLGEQRFTVYEAFSLSEQKFVAIKFFPIEKDNQIDDYYINELQAFGFDHPHVVKLLYSQDRLKTTIKSQIVNASIIISEYYSNGDFIDLFHKIDFCRDEKLVRTYFHQFMCGLEYIHAKGVAHLDLKCENLLLDNKFQLRVIDFDMASKIGSNVTHGRGTTNFRAPEVALNRYVDFPEADIYSAGIILFVLRFGYLPYSEKKKTSDQNLFHVLQDDLASFWDVHSRIRDDDIPLTKPFQKLFEAMVAKQPSKRASIKQIKQCKWFRGEIYSPEELTNVMSKKINEKIQN